MVITKNYIRSTKNYIRSKLAEKSIYDYSEDYLDELLMLTILIASKGEDRDIAFEKAFKKMEGLKNERVKSD